MNRSLLLAGVLGASGVAAGAMGAHALESVVTPERVEIWNTAAQYHLIHAVVILVLAMQSGINARLPILAMTAGVVLFSFSLYALVLLDVTAFAMITPLGGLLLIAGWLLLCTKAFAKGEPPL